MRYTKAMMTMMGKDTMSLINCLQLKKELKPQNEKV